MIKISLWAKSHIREARVLLAVGQVLLFIIAVNLGLLFQQLNVEIHNSVAIAAVVLIVFAVITYPRISGKLLRETYFKRKGVEIIFLCSTVICIAFISNKDSRIANLHTYQPLHGSFYSFEEKVKETPAHAKRSARRFFRKQIRELSKELKASKTSKAGKILLTSLVVLVGIGVLGLVAGLSCSLSCNGNEALAVLVVLGGVGLIFFLVALAIRKINRPKRPKEAAGTVVPAT